MSGGHFDYQQYRIEEIAEEVEQLIRTNDDTSLDEFGQEIGLQYSAETITKFKEAYSLLKQASFMAQRIDWLVSGDDGEDSFHERWQDELNKLRLQSVETPVPHKDG